MDLQQVERRRDAVVNNPTPPITEGIDEAALTTMLQTFRGYSYNVTEVLLAHPERAGPAPRAAETELVLHLRRGPGRPRVPVRELRLRLDPAQARPDDGRGLERPVLATTRAQRAGRGAGLPTVEPGLAVPAASLCRVPGLGTDLGNTFIIIAYHSANDRGADARQQLRSWGTGSGLRGLGDLDQFLSSGPPDDWWNEKKYPNVPTWTQLRATYSTGIAYSQLKVRTSTLWRWGRVSSVSRAVRDGSSSNPKTLHELGVLCRVPEVRNAGDDHSVSGFGGGEPLLSQEPCEFGS